MGIPVLFAVMDTLHAAVRRQRPPEPARMIAMLGLLPCIERLRVGGLGRLEGGGYGVGQARRENAVDLFVVVVYRRQLLVI